jgi:hypothetical protein
MMTRFLVFIAFIVFPVLLQSQQVKTVTGEAQVEFSRDKSRVETEQKARERAEINAIEKAFGTVIVQGNSTYISNLQTGQKVETNTVFNTIANTSVKGEVIQVLKERFTDIQGTRIIDDVKESVTEIKCEIEVKVKEIVTPPVQFTTFPLSCLDEKCRTTSFKDKDKLYFFFSSPMSGYLTIYFDDKSDTYCLYPYSSMPAEFEGGVPVTADKKYFLFSNKPEYNYFPGKNIVPDIYELDTKSAQDMNRIFVIFSKNQMNKPSLKDETGKLLDKKYLEQDYSLPKSLPSESFQKWLNSYRSSGKSDVQVEIIDITISK